MEAEMSYSLGSEEVINLFCDPCKHDGQDIEAMGFCVNCHEFLCGSCCTYHTKPLPCRDHTILHKEDMPKKKPLKPSLPVDGKVSMTDSVFDKCLKHEDEYLKYYCGDHFNFGCTVCMTIGHRACEHVQYIPEVVKTINDSTELKQFEDKLVRLTETARKNVIKAKRNETELKTSYNETKAQIEEFRVKINMRLDQLQNEIKLQADKLMQESTENMNRVEKDVSEVAEQVAHLKIDVDNLVQTRQNVKLFIKMKRSEVEANKLSAVVTQTMNKVKAVELYFEPDNKLQALVNDLQYFGRCRQIMSNAYTTLTYLREFNVRSSTDSEQCNIVDLVMLSVDMIVLADDSNDKVKVFDMKAGSISAERAISSIRAITRVDDNKVAVSYGGNVQLLSKTSQGITTLKTFPICDCFSLLFIKATQHLMAMTVFGEGVFVVALTENVLKRLKPDIKLKHDCCITNSSNDEIIYVTDVEKNRVCSYTTDGTQKAVYTADTLQEPRGMAVSKDGSVYVCGYKSNTIHALLPENATMQIVLNSTNGIKRPNSVTVNDVERQIIVCFEYSDVIKVYTYY